MIFPFKITYTNPNTNTNAKITKKWEKNISLRNKNDNEPQKKMVENESKSLRVSYSDRGGVGVDCKVKA